ncbi:MAG: hypothetical protein IPI73_08530 [Betaproteobacteria bacterium]|nr:hypothetical protein [Betaproteobacteria bacterium]
MDRRKFLSGVGTIGAAGVVATGFALRESGATKARAGGLAQAAGVAGATGVTPLVAAKARVADGLTLGYLPGSAGMFATPTVERLISTKAAGLRWSHWDPSLPAQAGQPAARSLFKAGNLVAVAIGILHRAEGVATGALGALDVTAHFAIDDAPYFAPFSAWRYEAAGFATRAKSTQAISFSARMPDRVALEVNYALNPSVIAGGFANAGMLYLPIGTSAASAAGLTTGLYVLAAPSAGTGVQPDMGAYVFSGNVRAPIVDPAGRAPDFDYLTLAIRPIAI